MGGGACLYGLQEGLAALEGDANNAEKHGGRHGGKGLAGLVGGLPLWGLSPPPLGRPCRMPAPVWAQPRLHNQQASRDG